MERLTLQGLIVDVSISKDGDWKKDIITIHFSKKLEDGRVSKIMQYLFDEGFIKDRRTLYILRKI